MKNKIFVLIMASLVLVISCLIYINSIKSITGTIWTSRSSMSAVFDHPKIPVFEESIFTKKIKKRSVAISQNNYVASVNNPYADLPFVNDKTLHTYGRLDNGSIYSKSKQAKDDDMSDLTLGGLTLLSSNRTISKKRNDINIGETFPSLSSSSSSTTLMGAHVVSRDNTILVDPGEDPDPNEMIPVGDGKYALLLLSLVYGGVMYWRRKQKL